MATTETIAGEVRERAGGKCELCGAASDVAVCPVPPASVAAADRSVLLCPTCDEQVQGAAPLDAKHWFCLREAAWSQVPAIQVVSYRLLSRLSSEGWAADLRDQLYLDADTLAWAEAGPSEAATASTKTVDSNGTELSDGDSVTLIKDLDVKGAGFVAKRGTLVKNIRLTDDPDNVDGRVNKVAIVLKTRFLKKAL